MFAYSNIFNDDDPVVTLKGMQFYAYHGCLDSERKAGGRYVVDLSYQYSIKKAARTDNLSYAVDYSKVYSIVKREMEKPSNLIEHVAKRILDAVYNETDATSVKVTVTKLDPPVGGQTESASVTMTL